MVKNALDLLKPLIGSYNVGQAKQIKRYRDWVAHRNPHKPTPAKIDPEFTRALLTRLALALETAAD
ncbi:MAG: hypothetical protein ACLFQ1_03160 [Halochromatium sp.]